jgi:hypothetical protein
MTSVSGLTGSMSSTSPKALPDRISAREILPGEALIDDSVFGRSHVLRGEGTPSDDMNTQRSKVVRADLAKNRLFLDRRSFEILALDSILPCITLQKRQGGESNRSNTEGIHFARAHFRIDRHSSTKLPRTCAVPG